MSPALLPRAACVFAQLAITRTLLELALHVLLVPLKPAKVMLRVALLVLMEMLKVPRVKARVWRALLTRSQIQLKQAAHASTMGT